MWPFARLFAVVRKMGAHAVIFGLPPANIYKVIGYEDFCSRDELHPAQ